jgi:hypothetical protein
MRRKESELANYPLGSGGRRAPDSSVEASIASGLRQQTYLVGENEIDTADSAYKLLLESFREVLLFSLRAIRRVEFISVELSGERKLDGGMSGFGGRLRPQRGCLAIRYEPAVDNWQDVKRERGRGDEPADHYRGERALHLRARTM